MIWILAWRNLWRNRFRTSILLASIVSGIVAGILIASWTNGLIDQRLETVIGEELGHLQIHHPSFLTERDPDMILEQADDIRSVLSADSRVQSVAPRLQLDAMIQSSSVTSGVRLSGIDPDLEQETTTFDRHRTEGTLDVSESHSPPMMISQALANKLNVRLDERVVLSFQNLEQDLTSVAFQVTSLYDSGFRERDLRQVFVQLQDLQPHVSNQDVLHELVVRLHDMDHSDEVALHINEQFPSVKAESWIELSPELRYLTQSGASMSIYIMGIILFALMFGILNTLLMSIFERMPELTMLLAVGLSKGRLFSMILLESILVTALGGSIGMIASWFLLQWLSIRGIDLTRFGGDSLQQWGFDSLVYPSLSSAEFFWISILILCTSVLAAIWPAIRAVRLHPIHRPQT
ncbi:MAG: ABC transporter permease [Bacteroidota bacterium]